MSDDLIEAGGPEMFDGVNLVTSEEALQGGSSMRRGEEGSLSLGILDAACLMGSGKEQIGCLGCVCRGWGRCKSRAALRLGARPSEPRRV